MKVEQLHAQLQEIVDNGDGHLEIRVAATVYAEDQSRILVPARVLNVRHAKGNLSGGRYYEIEAEE